MISESLMDAMHLAFVAIVWFGIGRRQGIKEARNA